MSKNIEEKIDKYLLGEGKGYKGGPDDGTKDSVEKGVKSFADNHGGSMPEDDDGGEKCVNAMEDEEGIDNPEALCAKIRDTYTGDKDGRGEE